VVQQKSDNLHISSLAPSHNFTYTVVLRQFDLYINKTKFVC